MAMNIEVNTEAEDAIRKTLEASGEIVEENEEKPSEESKEKPPAKSEAKTEDTEPKPVAAKSDAAPKEKKEEAQDSEKKEDWDSLPDWSKHRHRKDRETIRDLRDRIEDERAARTTAPAGGNREPAKETAGDSKEPEVTYSGIPEPVFEDFEKSEDQYRYFTKAHSKWAKDEAVAQVRSEMAVRDQINTDRHVSAAFDRRQTEMAELIPDYGEILEEATDVRASNIMTHLIERSDVGPAILIHLAKNPDECRRIFSLGEYVTMPNGKIQAFGDPEAAKRAMYRLETKVELEVEAMKAARKGGKATEPPKKKTVSSAPEPETPVRGTESKSKTDRELAGPSDRIVDMVKYNPELEKRRNEQRR